MRIALLGSNKEKFNLVFSEDVMNELKKRGEISFELIDKNSLEKHRDFLADCEAAFATWGMPELSEEEITMLNEK